MLQPIIIGFGRSGRDLHLRCLRKAAASEEAEDLFHQQVIVIDPYIKNKSSEDVAFCGSLQEAAGLRPSICQDAVLHICTPPSAHISVIKEAASAGFRHMIVEKPLTDDVGEIDALIKSVEEHQLDVIVVANWLSSRLTAKIQTFLEQKTFGNLQAVYLQQDKPRFCRTLENSSHGNAFDIEAPHQMALACFLQGADAEVIASETKDMVIGQQRYMRLGGAEAVLKHANGSRTYIASNLTSFIKQRTVKIQFEQYTLLGHFPPDGSDSYSNMSIYNSANEMVHSELIYDDPLSLCFIEYYQYFHGISQIKPVSDIYFNQKVIQLLEEAKAKSETKLHTKGAVI
ncbi:Gfo/Idh/MocA family protein [Bacillus inaquosorum]|uniref:Gfo/Idh/MocA family protein n=1 Tax=Bacillus inaquosorum TaxID=483913 RepID=UPI002280A43B|nr:Gfo/Idh/MocA family oxidoreductase [Bacillus inaquosorum]MCY7902829.1 Gfo/Idh/MocA family oxidoreductase [Bacillus inaquosorum]MCY8262193.1 Gfo/Idh/MocA family oxidoreductase [Bacillus inaquosorum]MCY8284572.1 Gfo/Idh/MocA family oxidoreductase [Bacillus inaquosorum]MCY9453471.1 Gfo/Idh/MocA family oxidoreductase [Bacillus inaquosorum]